MQPSDRPNLLSRFRAFSRSRAGIVVGAVCVAGFGSGLIVLDSWRTYKRDLAEAGRTGRNLVVALADQTTRTIQAVDKTLVAIADRPETMSLLANPDDPSNKRAFSERAEGLPQLLWLNVVDSQGRIVASTNAVAASVRSLAGREYFETARSAATIGQTMFSRIDRGRLSGRWFFAMTRRISGPDGSFAGLVTAAVDPSFFAQLYKNIDVGAQGNVTLFKSSGTIVARWPEHDGFIGRSAASGTLFTEHLPAAPKGTVRLRTSLQGREILLSYQAIGEYPFVINVAHDVAEVLGGWRRSLLASAAMILGIVVLTAAAAYLVWRNLERSRTLARVRQLADEAVRARELSLAEGRAKSAFFSAMSHELRTPLNGIIGYCQMLRLGLGGTPGSPRYDEYLGNIERSGQHLLETVNDILDLAKIAEGHAALREDVVRIRTLLSECVAIAQGMGVGRVRGLVLAGNALDEDVQADPLRLKQIILNLLSNAIKVSAVEHLVTLSAEIEPDSAITIAVHDEGPGMTAAEVAAALQPWSRPDVAVQRSFARTGLGLSLSKALTELHGGRLEIASTKGKGTTVRIALPSTRRIAPVDNVRPAA